MFSVIVPTLNAANNWTPFAGALLECVRPDQVLIIDSESSDNTVLLARSAGFHVCSLKRCEFNHGATRQMAAEMRPDANVLVYLTQDAVLAGPNTLTDLVSAFTDPQVGAAFGRQLPRPGAQAIEAHARLFNYPANSEVRSLASRASLGFKAAFLSNSLAAYRRSALMNVGGFPNNVIFGEDTITAARLLLAGYTIAYVAHACAYHSHPYSKLQEFKRYFDIGVLHSREHWLLDDFGAPIGEGKRFVLSELQYLLQRDRSAIPSALFRSLIKYFGYRLGRMERGLPQGMKSRLSMHSGFWS